MNKKIWIYLLIVLGVCVAVYFWFASGRPKLSPAGELVAANGNLEVTVYYHRPSVRGRKIFGPENENTLQPYGKYWRLGANAPTSIEFNRDVSFNGKPVPEGKYRMYAVPGENNFEIILNSEIGLSGAPEPDPSKDILRTNVLVNHPSEMTEQLTFESHHTATGINLVIKWANVELEIPINP
jgi:hypothetical protein